MSSKWERFGDEFLVFIYLILVSGLVSMGVSILGYEQKFGLTMMCVAVAGIIYNKFSGDTIHKKLRREQWFGLK